MVLVDGLVKSGAYSSSNYCSIEIMRHDVFSLVILVHLVNFTVENSRVEYLNRLRNEDFVPFFDYIAVLCIYASGQLLYVSE